MQWSKAPLIPLYRAIGDRLGEANVLQAIGQMRVIVALNEGNQAQYEQGMEILQASFELHQEIGERVGQVNTLMFLSRVAASMGRTDQALEIGQVALELSLEVGGKEHPVTRAFAEFLQGLGG